jgi:hypothetical protein
MRRGGWVARSGIAATLALGLDLAEPVAARAEAAPDTAAPT